jgi:hypothetical protein
MSESSSRYPCEDEQVEPTRHRLRKGKDPELARSVDCAIDARDQWMNDLTDWLKGLQNEVMDLRQRLEACENACGGKSGEGGTGVKRSMMMMSAQDPPKPPKPWP